MKHDQGELDAVAARVDARRSDFATVAERIWGFAEIRYQEHQSSDAQAAAMEAAGFRVMRGAAGMPTAFIAEAGSGKPVIGFLGELDALAGMSQQAGVAVEAPLQLGACGHGCGHNLLGVGAMMAAVATRDYLAANGLPGTVRYYCCPAEEGGSGKGFLARAGAFADVDTAVTWHPGCGTGVSTGVSLANIQAYFRFKGRRSHAADTPHLGRSALDAVELMNVGVNYLREHVIPEARMHYAVTDTGGISPNVVQAHAEALYLVRAPEGSEVQHIFSRVRKIAEGAALMTETELEVEIDKACLNLLHNETLEKAMQGVIEHYGPPAFDEADEAFARDIRKTLSERDVEGSARKFSALADRDKPFATGIMPYDPRHQSEGGSTDVSDVSWAVPTVQCWAACFALGTPFHSWQMVAQGKQPAAVKGMTHAAKIMAGTALRLFREPALLAEAQAEHDRNTGGRPYACPMPPEVLPPPLRKGKGRK